MTPTDSNNLDQTDATVTRLLLFGNSKDSKEINLRILNRDHSFSTYAKFSENEHFLTPDTHT